MSTINTITKPQTKCGEIYYEKNQKWCYLCVFCGKTTQNHDEFQFHFEEHLNECSEIKNFEKEATSNEDDGNTKHDQFNNDQEKEYLEDVLRGPSLTFIGKDATNEDVPFGIDIKRNEDITLSDLETCAGNSIKQVNNDSESSSKNDFDLTFSSTDLKTNAKRPYKPRNKAFFCTFCNKKFRRRYQYNTHLNIHTGAKPFQCEICGRQFRAVTTLQRHLNTHKQQTFVCQYCNKTFTHKVACSSHEIRHTQERNEQCDFCEKSFYTLNQLDTHKRRVHNKTNHVLPFSCDLCPNRYRSASMLSTHKCRKHLRTAKFKCEKCDKKFIDLQRLDEHKNIHFDGTDSTQYINLEKTSDM